MPDPVRRALVLAFALTWIPVSFGSRFYEHYFLQFVAPLAILAAPQAAALIRSWPAFSWRRRALTVVGCAVPALCLLCFLAFAMRRTVIRLRLISFCKWIIGPIRRPAVDGHVSAMLLRGTTDRALFLTLHDLRI